MQRISSGQKLAVRKCISVAFSRNFEIDITNIISIFRRKNVVGLEYAQAVGSFWQWIIYMNSTHGYAC